VSPGDEKLQQFKACCKRDRRSGKQVVAARIAKREGGSGYEKHGEMFKPRRSSCYQAKLRWNDGQGHSRRQQDPSQQANELSQRHSYFGFLAASDRA